MDDSNKDKSKTWETLQQSGASTGSPNLVQSPNNMPGPNQSPTLATASSKQDMPPQNNPLAQANHQGASSPAQPSNYSTNSAPASQPSSDAVPKPTIVSSSSTPKPTASSLGIPKVTGESPNAPKKPIIQFSGPRLNPIDSRHSGPEALIGIANLVSSKIQTNTQNNQSASDSATSQQASSDTTNTDDELLKAFIGQNYEKITSGSFNVAGFFFPTLYMFYRKMFAYALILFLVNLAITILIANLIKIPIPIGVINVLSGFFVNKVYIFHARKKITKIKAANSQKSLEELKAICTTKGGTNIGLAVAGFFVEVGIYIVVLVVAVLIGLHGHMGEILDPNNPNSLISMVIEKERQNNNKSNEQKGTLVENINVSGYACMDSQCKVTTVDSKGNSAVYSLDVDDSIFKKLNEYQDYIKLDIYYEQKGEVKTIVDYKIFLKSTNEDITNVKTEDELRSKIGLYSVGTHTGTFTLTEIGMDGFSMDGDKSYGYKEYTFADDKKTEYTMKHIINNGPLNLVEGNKYTVTFEVTKGDLGYDFIIKSVE